MSFYLFAFILLSVSTHHDSSSEEPPHVFHLLGDVALSCVLDGPGGEEQHDVTEDGDEHERIQRKGDAFGTFCSTHLVRVDVDGCTDSSAPFLGVFREGKSPDGEGGVISYTRTGVIYLSNFNLAYFALLLLK